MSFLYALSKPKQAIRDILEMYFSEYTVVTNAYSNERMYARVAHVRDVPLQNSFSRRENSPMTFFTGSSSSTLISSVVVIFDGGKCRL